MTSYKMIPNKKFLTMIAKDFIAGELTDKEFLEQAMSIQFAGTEGEFDQFVGTLDDATLGKLFRRFWEGMTYDTSWEGYSPEERFTVLKACTDMKVCYENGINDDAPGDGDGDRSKGGAVPDGA